MSDFVHDKMGALIRQTAAAVREPTPFKTLLVGKELERGDGFKFLSDSKPYDIDPNLTAPLETKSSFAESKLFEEKIRKRLKKAEGELKIAKDYASSGNAELSHASRFLTEYAEEEIQILTLACERFEQGTFREAIDMVIEVIDAHGEYDTSVCCDGRECGCHGATAHDMMKHYIKQLKPKGTSNG